LHIGAKAIILWHNPTKKLSGRLAAQFGRHPTLLINPVNIVFCDIRLENWKRELKPIQLRHLMSIPGFHIELAQRRADKQSASKAIVSSIGRLRSPCPDDHKLPRQSKLHAAVCCIQPITQHCP
jgi:hypothetical protein